MVLQNPPIIYTHPVFGTLLCQLWGFVNNESNLWIFLPNKYIATQHRRTGVMYIYGILNVLLTYSMEQSPSWESLASQLVKKSSAFYGTRRFITVFASARYLFLSWATLIQSMHPHPTFWRSILMLSTHLRLSLLYCNKYNLRHCKLSQAIRINFTLFIRCTFLQSIYQSVFLIVLLFGSLVCGTLCPWDGHQSFGENMIHR